MLLRRLWRIFLDPREIWPPGCSQQQAPWKRRCHHQGSKTPARRRRDEYWLTSLLSTSSLEKGLAIHQETNVEVLPRGVLQQDGRASRIRKVTVEHHILVRFPGACLQRPIGKVQIRQSNSTLDTWVRTPFWLMGEDTLRYLITGEDTVSALWVRTPPSAAWVRTLLRRLHSLVNVWNFRTTRAEYLMHYAVGIDTHRYGIKSSNFSANRQISATYRLDYYSRMRSGHTRGLDVHAFRVWARWPS